MSDHPNERTTLLAKRSRNSSENSAEPSIENYASYTRNSSRNYTDTDNETDSIGSEFNDFINSTRRDWRLYLVEPMVLILLFAYNLSSTVLKNQIIFQTCTAIFQYNESDCKLLGGRNVSEHTKDIETSVQPYAARIFMTIMIVNCIVPALFGVFIGAWSDRFGRKPLLIIAFSGYALYYILTATICFANVQTPINPWYYLLAGLPLAILGGSVTYSVAALCFISDVSSVEEIPYRMVIYEAAVYTGLMIGSLTSGFIYEAYGSATVFSTSAFAIVLALLILLIFLPESLNLRRYPLPSDDPYNRNDNNEHDSQTTGTSSYYNLLKEMWTTCFKEREYNDRSILWFAIASLLMIAFVVDGSMTVFYLFAREQFHWTVKQFTIYETFSILAPVIGNLLGVLVLRKFLGLSILTLAVFSFLSQAACSFVKGFAINDWQIYVAIVLGALKSMGNPMCRTIITNLVPANELGKILSFQSVVQSFLPFLASPIYTLVYSLTLSTFPGFFNVLSAHLFLLSIAFLLVISRKKRLQPERYDAILT